MHLCSLNHKSFLLEKQVKNLLLSLSHTVGVSQKLLMETLTCVRFGLRASQVTLTRSSLFRFTLSASFVSQTAEHACSCPSKEHTPLTIRLLRQRTLRNSHVLCRNLVMRNGEP